MPRPSSSATSCRASWSCRALLAVLLVAVLALAVGFLHPAPARRLLRADDPGASPPCSTPSRFAGPSSPAARAASAGSTRPAVLGIDLGDPWIYLIFVSLVGLLVAWFLLRGGALAVRHACWSPSARTSSAPRFQGYATNRYKLHAFLISASVTGLAGVLFIFHHRFVSADPLAITFSGELLAMVVIGGMHSFLGPALGAAVLHHLPRVPVALDARLAALFRPPVRRLRDLLARGPGRRRPAAPRPVPQGAGRGCGHGRPHHRQGRPRCRPSCARPRPHPATRSSPARAWSSASAASTR